MLYMPLQDLTKKVSSLFKLTLLAARRAQQLNEGVKPVIESESHKVSSIALEEIAQGKVKL